MDDLGQVREVFVDTYEFINVRAQRTLSEQVPRPPNHQNLLASSAIHGVLYAAIGSTLKICSLSDLRDPPNQSASDSSRHECDAPINTIDLSSHDVSAILHILLLLNDSILAVLATRASDKSKTFLFFLHVTALSQGTVMRRPAPLVSGVTTIAVPPCSTRDSSTLFACIVDNNSLYVHRVSETEAVQVAQTSVQGALSLALTPCASSVIVAVGTSRGNVILFNANTCEKIGTIVEVESGWLPVQVHFAGDSYIFTTYKLESNTTHIMWHLQHEMTDQNVISTSVVGHSPLGELCYLSYFNDDDDDDDDDDKKPSIMFSFIDEWNLAVVSSSTSSDIAIIAKSEETPGDGKWANYKVDDTREAVMPLDDGDDTMPLGMTFDFNNTTTIPAPDPDDPDINPMPTLVVLSNTGVLLSYRLVDDKKNAKCTLVREPQALPPLPSPVSVPEPSSEPEFHTSTESNTAPSASNNTETVSTTSTTTSFAQRTMSNSISNKAERPYSGSTPPKTFATPTFGSGKPSPFPLPSADATTTNVTGSSTKSTFGFGPSSIPSKTNNDFHPNSPTGDPFNYPSAPATTSATPFKSTKPLLNNANINSKSTNLKASTIPPFSVQSPAAKPQPAFPPKIGNVGAPAFSSTLAGTTKIRDPFSMKPAADNAKQSSNPIDSITRKLAPVRLHSKLDESLNAVKYTQEGDALGAIRSILHEMAAELDLTREASRAMWEQLNAMKPGITSVMESITKEVNNRLTDLAKVFETEKKMRASATECMKKVLKLHRDYEIISMEDDIRRDDATSRYLREEYRQVDEQMMKKEADIEKNIRLIESKLEPSELERRRRTNNNPTETMQMVYSCISLQGLRIKRLLTLLKSLSDRADAQDQNGRRSDLGLSLARLEKLSLSSHHHSQDQGNERFENDENATNGNIERKKLVNTIGQKHGLSVDKDRHVDNMDRSKENRSDDDEQSLVSSEVLSVLRRLAMRGGRSNITVESSSLPSGTSSSGLMSTRRRSMNTTTTTTTATSNTIATSTTTASFATHTPTKVPTSSPAPAPHSASKPPKPQRSQAQMKQSTSPFGAYEQFPPPPPPPSNQRVDTHTTPSSFSSRPSRTSYEPFKTAINTSGTKETTFSLFSSGQSQSSIFSNKSTTNNIRSENPSPAKSSPQTSSSTSTSASTPDRDSKATTTNPTTTNPQDETSLPTIDITKNRGWNSIPFAATPFAQPPPVPPSFRSGSTTTPLSKSSTTTSTATSKPQFAAMPPDDSLKKNDAPTFMASKPTTTTNTATATNSTPASTSKPSSTSGTTRSAQYASLPPDDDLTTTPPSKARRGKQTLSSSVSSEAQKTSIPVATLPPDIGADLKKESSSTSSSASAQKKSDDDVSKKSNSLFAALPPDNFSTSESKTTGSKVEKKSENKSGLFASLPPDDNDSLSKNVKSKEKKSEPSTSTTAPPLFGNAASAPSFSISGTFNASPSSTPSSHPTSATVGSSTTTTTQQAQTTESAPSSADPSLSLFGSQLSLGGSNNNNNEASKPKPNDEKSGGTATSLFGIPVNTSTSNSSSGFGSFGGGGGASPFAMANSSNNNSSSAFGLGAPFGAGSNTSTSGFGGSNIFGNVGGGNASLFQAATSELTKTPTLKPNNNNDNNNNNMVATNMGGGGGEGTSSEDDSDNENGQNRSGMETTTTNTIGGFGNESTPQQQIRSSSASGFGNISGSGNGVGGINLFGSGGGGGATFGATSSFGISSNNNNSGFGSAMNTISPSVPTFGATSSFGVAAANATSSAFGTPSTLGASGFGAAAAAAAGATPKFGEATTFGSGGGGGGGFGGGAAAAGQSPFGSISGGGGGNSGASPFGAAAQSGASGFTAFGGGGNDSSGAGGLSFGNGQVPAFTSSSFFERRA